VKQNDIMSQSDRNDLRKFSLLIFSAHIFSIDIHLYVE